MDLAGPVAPSEWSALKADPALPALRLFAAARLGPRANGAPLAIAFSGGADSTALLLAALHLWGPQRLHALHVHHGLQADADQFAEHARSLCVAWGVPCSVLRVRIPARRGESLEDAARGARYAALTKAACELGLHWLLLGHQADDQAESLLLALLRGAGPKGLAGMPAVASRAGLWLGRPLLSCAADALRHMLDSQGVPYVHDAMNRDPAFRRSRIRHELLPVLARLEPSWRATLARAADLCAQASTGIEEMAQQDLALCKGGEGLRLVALRALPDARLSEVLRLWLRQSGLRSNHGQIVNLRRQVRATARGAVALQVRLEQGTVERCGSWLTLRAGDCAPAGRGLHDEHEGNGCL